MLFSLKGEQILICAISIDLKNMQYTRHRRTNMVWSRSYEASRIGQFIETEKGLQVTRAWGRRDLLFNRHRSPVSETGNVLKTVLCYTAL